jgi:hypothetical protein
MNDRPRRAVASAAALLVLWLLGGALLSCKSGGESKGVDWGDGLTGGELVFEDGFDRAELGPRWVVEGPTWRIVDGWLHDTTARNAGAWLDLELPEKVRVEFSARSELPPTGEFRGDIKCEIFCTEKTHQTGYVLIFGGWLNTINVIARLDEHGKDRLEDSRRKVIAGQTYRWAVVRTDGVLRWYLDGKPFMHFADPDPVRGRFFGFNNWESHVYYDDLKVWRL